MGYCPPWQGRCGGSCKESCHVGWHSLSGNRKQEAHQEVESSYNLQAYPQWHISSSSTTFQAVPPTRDLGNLWEAFPLPITESFSILFTQSNWKLDFLSAILSQATFRANSPSLSDTLETNSSFCYQYECICRVRKFWEVLNGSKMWAKIWNYNWSSAIYLKNYLTSNFVTFLTMFN